MAEGLHKILEGWPSPAFSFADVWKRCAERAYSDGPWWVIRPQEWDYWVGRVDAAGWPTRDAPTDADG